MQNIAYGYDSVGNILSLIDSAPLPKRNEYGGQSTQHFWYDDLYRLVKADGVYTTAREVQNYDLAMAYTPIHNITHKNQLHTVSKIGGTPRTEAATTYDWAYTYKDLNHTQPHAPTHIGERSYSYDANGNQTGWQSDVNGTRRTIVWDEDNRIREVQDPKHGAAFTYDDQGERKLRKSQYGETAYINQFFTVRNGAIASTHVYAGTSRIVTKVGAGTPVGKTTNLKGTGNLSPTGMSGDTIVITVDGVTTGGGAASTSMTTTTTPSPLAGITNDLAGVVGQPSQMASSSSEGGGEGLSSNSFPGQGLEHRSDRANEVARNTEKNKHLNGGIPGGEHGAVNSNAGGNGNAAGTSNNPGNSNTGDTGGNAGGGQSGGNTGGSTSGGAGSGNGMEFIYFYHPDHLGSTGYVTDEKAQRYEHIAYFPFGETWVQEASATWRVPYQFTSKEMDSETGLYYFGSRYYDPRTSVWQSADPILAKYLPTGNKEKDAQLPGMGGAFNSLNLAMYTYGHQNPVKFTDPDGNAVYMAERGIGNGSSAGQNSSGKSMSTLAATGGHTWIIARPDNRAEFSKARPDIQLDNSGAFVMRAGPDAKFDSTGKGNLVGSIGGGDSTTQYRQRYNVATPSGYKDKPDMSADTQFIVNLVKQAEGYSNDLPYHGTAGQLDIPGAGGIEKGASYYNSNSFTSGVLKGAGVKDVPNPWGYQPGLDKPVTPYACPIE
jgi:RHS repeat-associated protein